MQTTRVPVAEGVELAVDSWAPAGAASPPGPPFLLVHGLASNARLWDGVAERLVEHGHRVASVDLRGHGRSSKPEAPYDVATVADDLASVASGLGLDHPIVAGQSWGGNVVLELGARHPGVVRGVVCVDGGWLEPSRSFASWEACRDALAPPRLAGRHLDQIEGYIRSAHPDWPEAGILGTLANFEVRPDGTIAPWLTYERHLVVLRGLFDHHPSERYPAVGVPVLLVPADTGAAAWSERKRVDVDRAQAALPVARTRWLGGDHDIHAQHPVELADMMSDMTRDGFFS